MRLRCSCCGYRSCCSTASQAFVSLYPIATVFTHAGRSVDDSTSEQYELARMWHIGRRTSNEPKSGSEKNTYTVRIHSSRLFDGTLDWIYPCGVHIVCCTNALLIRRCIYVLIGYIVIYIRLPHNQCIIVIVYVELATPIKWAGRSNKKKIREEMNFVDFDAQACRYAEKNAWKKRPYKFIFYIIMFVMLSASIMFFTYIFGLFDSLQLYALFGNGKLPYSDTSYCILYFVCLK